MSMLISVDEAKAALNWTTTSSADDDELTFYIEAVTPIIEDIVGSCVPTTYTETYDGGGPQITLLHKPVLSVTTVKESYGAAYYTLTEQDPFGGAGYSSFGFTVDYRTGVMTRRASGSAVSFVDGTRNVQVTYQAGRLVIPFNIVMAAREELRFLWQNGQQATWPGTFTADDAVFTPAGYAVPRRVVELCAAERRLPGIG